MWGVVVEKNNTKTLECTGKAEKQSVYFVIVRVGSRKSMFLTFKSQPSESLQRGLVCPLAAESKTTVKSRSQITSK